jgi:MFS family permease
MFTPGLTHRGISGHTRRLQRATPLLDHRPYRVYVLAVLFLGYVVNVMDRGVLGILLEPIKRTFHASDTELGLLGGLAFALFYAVLGIPIATLADRWSRRSVLAIAAALWGVMTTLCGMASTFGVLLLARAGTAVGEAGGSPPSHSLISDYYPIEQRATALSVYALGVPIGAMLGSFLGGWGNELYGWRLTFILIGLPGLAIALLVRLTVSEPPRGYADGATAAMARAAAPRILEVFGYLWRRTSFRHLCLAAALHSVVWYAGSTFNAVFFIRSHHMTTGEAGSWIALYAGVSAVGTFFAGHLADRLSVRARDRRWYLWLPGYATLVMVPIQFVAYLAASLWVVIPAFCVMMVLAAFFFGPSFAMTQALATFRMRAVATSLLLFVQTLIGLGLGPLVTGLLSDRLAPDFGTDSLRYGLVLIGLVNLWAAAHYFHGARFLRADLDHTESVTRASQPKNYTTA